MTFTLWGPLLALVCYVSFNVTVLSWSEYSAELKEQAILRHSACYSDLLAFTNSYRTAKGV